jgi:non-ribosomal peptide synthetase component F/acyl carrier protein
MSIVEFLSDLRNRGVNLWVENDTLRYQAPRGVMTQEMLAELARKKNEIIAFLLQVTTEVRPPREPILPVSRGGALPQSFAQQRMWLVNQLEPDSAAYHIPFTARISGPLNLSVFEQSLNRIVKRHESLRTTFATADDQPVQRIADTLQIPVIVVDLSAFLEPEQAVETRRMVNEEVQKPFDLARGPLVRCHLFKWGETEFVLLLNMHHIISDGGSMGVFFREFRAFYETYLKGEGIGLPELTTQYADFAVWQHKLFVSGEYKKQEHFWMNTLNGEVPVLNMPLDFQRPARQTFHGKTTEFTISKETVTKVEALIKNQGVSLHILLFSIYAALLNQYSGQEDLVIGSLVAGRQHPDLENIIGVFINFLPIRIKIDPEQTFSDFLGSVKDTMLNAYENQDFPFEKIVETLKIKADPSRNPIFDTMLVFHGRYDFLHHLQIADLTFSRYEYGGDTATLDFKMDVFMSEEEKLNCLLEYNTGLFTEESMKTFIRHFQLLIDRVTDNSGEKISGLNCFSQAEILQIEAKRRPDLASQLRINLVVSATFTAEPIEDHLKWWLKRFEMDGAVHFAPYHQVYQELLDPSSLVSANTGLNLLLIRFEDFIRDDHSPDEVKSRKMERNCNELTEILAGKQKTAPYLVGVFPVSTHLAFSDFLVHRIEAINLRWKQALEKIEKVQWLDFADLQGLYNIDPVFDAVKDKAGHLPFSEEYYAALGATIARKIAGIFFPETDQETVKHLPFEHHSGKQLLKLPVHPEIKEKISRAEYKAPENEREASLVKMYQEILGVARIGIDDNFFELGGHSLKAVSLVSRIHKEFNVEVPLREVFKATIKELAEAIKGAVKNIYLSIPPVEKKDYYPVSSAQRRMYATNRLNESSTSYNLPGATLIEGNPDQRRLEDVLQKLITRHEALRTSFEVIHGEPVQRIHPEAEFEVKHMADGDEHMAYSIWHMADGDSQDQIQKIIRDFIRPFDLSKAPLLRAGLVKLARDRHLLIFDMHHIISDGTSMSILVREFISLYDGTELPPLKIQYKDFSQWQNELFATGALKQQEEFWVRRFSQDVPVLSLPTDYPRPPVQSFDGDRVYFEAGEELTAGINQLALETETTLYMVLLAVFQVLLSKYTAQEEIIIGSPVAGRPHTDLENVVGMFVNLLAMRNFPEGEKTFAAFLQEVRENAFQAYQNQEYRLETLPVKLGLHRDRSRNPLFDVLFVLQNMDVPEMVTADLKFRLYSLDHKVSQFDLTLEARSADQKISFALEYCTKLFKPETAARIAGNYLRVLEAVVGNPNIRIREIGLENVYPRMVISGAEFENERRYRTDKLSGEVAASGFPVDFSRPKLDQYQKVIIHFQFPDDLSEWLISMGDGLENAVYLLLATGVIYLLFRYTGKGEVIAGTPVFTQDGPGTYLSNFLALRSEVKESDTFKDCLLRLRQTVSEAGAYQNFPSAGMAELLNHRLDDERNPLFNTVFLLENIQPAETVGDLKADTVFVFLMEEETIKARIEYNSHLFRKEKIEQIACHLTHFFDIVTRNPNLTLSEVKSDGQPVGLVSPGEGSTAGLDCRNHARTFARDVRGNSGNFKGGGRLLAD